MLPPVTSGKALIEQVDRCCVDRPTLWWLGGVSESESLLRAQHLSQGFKIFPIGEGWRVPED